MDVCTCRRTNDRGWPVRHTATRVRWPASRTMVGGGGMAAGARRNWYERKPPTSRRNMPRSHDANQLQSFHLRAKETNAHLAQFAQAASQNALALSHRRPVGSPKEPLWPRWQSPRTKAPVSPQKPRRIALLGVTSRLSAAASAAVVFIVSLASCTTRMDARPRIVSHAARKRRATSGRGGPAPRAPRAEAGGECGALRMRPVRRPLLVLLTCRCGAERHLGVSSSANAQRRTSPTQTAQAKGASFLRSRAGDGAVGRDGLLHATPLHGAHGAAAGGLRQLGAAARAHARALAPCLLGTRRHAGLWQPVCADGDGRSARHQLGVRRRRRVDATARHRHAARARRRAARRGQRRAARPRSDGARLQGRRLADGGELAGGAA